MNGGRILLAVAAWVALSIPVAILTGRRLRRINQEDTW